MKCRLIQSYYSFDMSDKEMGKLRRMRGIASMVNRIAARPHIKGVIFTDSAIQINVEANSKDVEEEVAVVEGIIKEELI